MTSGWRNLRSEQRDLAARMFDALDTIDSIAETMSAGRPRRIGMSDLFAFVNDPDQEMGPQLATALAESEMLRDDLSRLLERTARYRFPLVAAASSGPVARRDGELYRIALRPSRAEPSQVYIVIDYADLDAPQPQLIYVCRPGCPCEKHRLPAAHDGTIQILADEASPLVEALRDRRAEVFLR